MCNLKKKKKNGTLLKQVLLQVSLVSPTKTHTKIRGLSILLQEKNRLIDQIYGTVLQERK